MKHFLSRIFSRATLVGVCILAQVAALLVGMRLMNDRFEYFYGGCMILSMLIVLGIVAKDSNPSYKIAWIIPIMLFPVFGGLLYLIFGRDRGTPRERARIGRAADQAAAAMEAACGDMDALAGFDPEAALMSRYIRLASGAPAFARTQTAYLSQGETYFTQLISALEGARKFIFLEYYIIETGALWDRIHSVLRRKAAQGLDVRVLIDDFGTMFRLPPNYDQALQREGIQAKVFNRFLPVLSSRFNNRDHRKIAVIDGNLGFTGGVNIADRYINAGGFDGHWLDSGVMLKGEAVYALTVMFLSAWNGQNPSPEAFSGYAPEPEFLRDIPSDGWVQPFSDTPLDNEETGATVYRSLASRAKEYVYINTPYLMIGSDMITALTTAAKCGVDVRIVTPARSDSRLVQEMTRSYYEPLLRGGVRVYEYTPGMVHAKTFLTDDRYGVVGTINLDYRSLYLHFECAVWMAHSSALTDMKQAYLKELEHCAPVTLADCLARSRGRRLWRAVLRVLAPLF